MKKMKLLFILCVLLIAAVGCHGKNKDEDRGNIDSKVKIYYTNESRNALVYEKRDFPNQKDSQMSADQMLSWMKEEPEEDEYFIAIPSEIVINNVVARNNIVNIDFAVGYGSLDKSKDVTCRAAIVKTLLQIPGIDYVEFSIGGKTMMDANGTPIGSLTSDSFVFDELPMEE